MKTVSRFVYLMNWMTTFFWDGFLVATLWHISIQTGWLTRLGHFQCTLPLHSFSDVVHLLEGCWIVHVVPNSRLVWWSSGLPVATLRWRMPDYVGFFTRAVLRGYEFRSSGRLCTQSQASLKCLKLSYTPFRSSLLSRCSSSIAILNSLFLRLTMHTEMKYHTGKHCAEAVRDFWGACVNWPLPKEEMDEESKCFEKRNGQKRKNKGQKKKG